MSDRMDLHRQPRESVPKPNAATATAFEKSVLEARIAELQVSQARHQGLLDAIPDLVFRIHEDGTYLEYHGPTEELALTPDQFLGRNVKDFFTEELADRMMTCAREAIQTGGVQTLEYALNIPIDSDNVQYYEGRYARCGEHEAVLVTRRISDRVQADRMLRRALSQLEETVSARTAELQKRLHELRREAANRSQVEQTLRDRESRLRLITDSLPALIAYLERDLTYRFANAMHRQLLGVSPDSVLGKPMAAVLGDSFVAALSSKIDQVLSGVAVECERELTLPAQTDRSRQMYIRLVPHRDGTDVVAGFYFLALDVTDRRTAEDEASRRLWELSHIGRLHLLGQMTAGIAHELNQPIGAISILAGTGKDWLESPTVDASDILREIISEIEQESLRAGEIIRVLRQFARKHQPRNSTLDVNALVTSVTRMLASNMRQNQIKLKLQFADHLPEIQADAIQIEQILVNLVRNAIEAMESVPREERELAIHTSMDGQRFAKVTVQDRGCGVGSDFQDSLFEAFATTKESGLGMGLAISRSIAEAHGGELRFRSSSDRGATFELLLPIIKVTS